VVVRAADVLGGRRVVRRDSGDIRHADRRLAIPARDHRTARHRNVPRVLRESTTDEFLPARRYASASAASKWGISPDLRSGGTSYLRSTTYNNRSCTSQLRPGTFLLGSTTLLGRIQASNTI